MTTTFLSNEPSSKGDGRPIYRPDLFDIIDSTIEALGDELRELSLDIHGHPELKWEEHHAHDVLTAFMTKHGFQVDCHYLLETAWRATFTHGQGGRTIGVNSEMDALPGIGHACGHNLIAIAGVAVACAIKEVLEKENIDGKVVLFGTPAEEGGGGKIKLLERGAYEGMDACVMCHPGAGPPNSAALSSSLALKNLQVEYTGHTAHAAIAPWEGKNAMDAAVAAHTNIGLLRQQLKPDNRVHGVFGGRDWATNVIPDNATMSYYIRSETWAEVLSTVARVENCFEAGALATGCEIDIKVIHTSMDLRQNKALGDEFANIFGSKFGFVGDPGPTGSTDFGDVTYALPSIHPGYSIPTLPDGGNHTRAFADSAATVEAHQATLNVSKSLAAVGMRVLTDEAFLHEVKRTFEVDKGARGDV